MACDFFTVDAAFMRRYHVLFFVPVDTREVCFASVTANPTGAWTTQAARNLFIAHAEPLNDALALVRDRGSQFIDAFDEIFRTIIWNQHQLQRLVVDDIDHYNLHRPHRSLEQRPPRPIDKPKDAPPTIVPVLRTSRCDGLIHGYRNAA